MNYHTIPQGTTGVSHASLIFKQLFPVGYLLPLDSLEENMDVECQNKQTSRNCPPRPVKNPELPRMDCIPQILCETDRVQQIHPSSTQAVTNLFP